MLLIQLSAGFQSLPPLPTSKLGPSGADSWVGGFVYVLGPCGSLQQTLLGGWEFLPLMQPPQFFTVRGFEALFPHTRTLSCVVCLATQLFLLVYLDMNVGPLALPAEALPGSSPPQLPVFTSPTGLDECFFFNSLIVGLPYSSIFCQF